MYTLFGKRGETLQQLMNFCVVVPVFLAMGFSLSFFGGITGYHTLYTQFPQINIFTTHGAVKTHNSLIKGTTVATLNLGATLGCLSTLYLGNKLGRRKTILIGGIVGVAGTILQCAAFSLAQLLVARIVLGAGLGMMTSTVPVWQSETSTVRKRGHHVIVDGVCIAAGAALSSWLTFGFSLIDTQSSWNWRLPCMTTGILSVMVVAFTFAFPESPRWLALKGRYEEARQVISIIDDVEVDSEHVDFILSSITSMNDVYAEKASFSSLFKYGREKIIYRLLIASATQLYSTMSGSAIITYYSETLFTAVGLSHNMSRILGASDLTFKLLCCAIPYLLIERAGRRKLLMISGAGMSVCMFCLAICGSQVTEDNLVPAYIAIVFAFLFVAFFPMGFLGVNFLYSQEVISTRYRAPASGISTATHWLSAFVIVLTTPIGFTSLGWKFYLVWAVVAGSIVPTVFFFYPETTALSVEEIDKVFIDAPTVFSVVALAATRRREKLANGLEGGRIEHFDDQKRKEEYLEQAVADSREPQVYHT